MSKYLFMLVAVAGLLSCTATKGTYEDGVYFAQDREYASSGWKYNVTVVVEDGQIEEVSWNGSNVKSGVDKKTLSESGQYPMQSKGGAMAPWYVQAKAVEDFFIETQNLEAITLTDDAGHTDAISGATIKVGDFIRLVEIALEKGPVGYGPYRDGYYQAQEEAFDAKNGLKGTMGVTITSGYIVSVDWDGVKEDGSTKEQISIDGGYPMVENGGAMAPWHEQAAALEAYVISSQTATQADAVSGATISYDPFYVLLDQALSGATK
ncbi:MAG: FMN-binding protein [Spirochaetales bacterium]|nr:FMN-binding protein [Spirochaetales bacterium]